ncbi:MAG: hypothetical protein O3C49_06565 [Proteobacteria bacterium]|nr:hypothetical protein [Pseudomonadota bacterium]
MIAPLEDDAVLVEVRVNNNIIIAAELAAIAGSKPVSELLEDILVEYLEKTGYLSDPETVSPRLSPT